MTHEDVTKHQEGEQSVPIPVMQCIVDLRRLIKAGARGGILEFAVAVCTLCRSLWASFLDAATNGSAPAYAADVEEGLRMCIEQLTIAIESAPENDRAQIYGFLENVKTRSTWFAVLKEQGHAALVAAMRKRLQEK